MTGYLKIHKMLWFGIESRNVDFLPVVRAVNYFTVYFIPFQSDNTVAIILCAKILYSVCEILRSLEVLTLVPLE